MFISSHIERNPFPPRKTRPEQSHRCFKSDFTKCDPCNYREVASSVELCGTSNGSNCVSVFNFKRPRAPLSSPRLLASKAHMGCSLYLFPQVFRPIEWRPFCRIRGPVITDITSSWWRWNVAVRLMGYPTEAETVWSTTKDHLQVCRESALITTLTTRGNSKTPAQASLQSPSMSGNTDKYRQSRYYQWLNYY